MRMRTMSLTMRRVCINKSKIMIRRRRRRRMRMIWSTAIRPSNASIS